MSRNARTVFATLSLLATATAAHAAPPALSGTWAVQRTVKTSYELPLVGLVTNTQMTRALWRFEPGSGAVPIAEQLCGIRTKTSDPNIGATFAPGFPKGVSGTYLKAELGGPGKFVARGTHVVGAELPPGAALPVKPDDPAVRDTDKDGEPGFTVTLKGVIAGAVRYVRREQLTYTGAMTDDTIEGTVEFGVEQVAIDATNQLLLIPIPETIEKTWFKAKRVADSTTCKAVLK